MMVKPILSRVFAVLVSLTMLFGASPSFAAMDCCEPANMAMHMADMAQNGSADHHKSMPCKMPAGSCGSICAAMASIAFTTPQVASVAPAVTGEPTWSVTSLTGGISQPPALPPPITRA